MRVTVTPFFIALALAAPEALLGQDTTTVRLRGDSVSVRFVDAELRAVLQSLGRYLDRPLFLTAVPQVRVTFETPRPVPRGEVLPLLRGLVQSHNLELVRDSSFYQVRQREQPVPTAPEAARQESEIQLTVVRLRHARAVDVAATLAALYGTAGADLGGGGRPGTLSDELRRNVVPPQGPGRPGPIAPTGQPGARSAVLEAAVTVVPDAVTNALLIRATARDAELLQHAIRELDVRPLQVLIEVVIAEARRDRLTAWGLDVFAPEQRLLRTGDATVQGSSTGGGLGDLVIRFMNLGRADVDATLRMGTTRGNVRILSRPALLVANNQQARFLVGSQRPFVQVSRSLPTEAPTRDQVIQYKDVGTRLIIRPTISADGYVTLDITQEVSSATTETAFEAPVISTREASTQVLVRDSQTIVLGGLIDHQEDVTSGGIPLLSELPLIGGLFGRQSRRTAETELFLFLTPRVLRTDQDVEAATREFQTQQRP